MHDLVIYYPEGHTAHFERGHPERPERIEAIRQALDSMGWWNSFPHLAPVDLPEDLLYSIHSPAYIDILQTVCARGGHLDADTYTTTASWELAMNSAGGATAIASAVWEGSTEPDRKGKIRGLALTRPPGHHATKDRGMGFCLLNNVALAAEYLLRAKMAAKIAIVDLDLHHGNGTQDIFWSRNDVLYISTHQSPLYPGTGHLDEIGAGVGKGFTVNFPLPPATGDAGFQTIVQEIILPLLDRFAPEMILISVGFDTHWLDPLGHLQLSASGNRDLIRSLVAWADEKCKGRVALFLEGGYDLEAGKAYMSGAVAAMIDHPWEDPLGPSPRPEGSSWKVVAKKAREIWDV